MRKDILLLGLGISVLALIGCANTSANLQRETARFIGGISSEQVTVSDVQRGMTDVKWKAETPNGLYNCEADDMVRRVNCTRQSSGDEKQKPEAQNALPAVFYSGSKSSSATKNTLYQKPIMSTSVFKPKVDKFAVWFDSSKWKKLDPDGNQVTFNHKDGELHAKVITERTTFTNPDGLKELKEVALMIGRKVSPDVKVTFEDKRIVNGKTILCMRFEGEIKSMQFVQYGYYYTGKEGTIQVLTYVSQNVYPEYESEMIEFLNGLTIND